MGIFDDLADDGMNRKSSVGGVDLKRVLVANGGEAHKALVECSKCKGKGTVVIGYANQRVATCFGCNGKGQISIRTVAARKGIETRKANDAQWAEDHAEEISFLRSGAEWSDFYRSLYDQFCDRQRLSEGQLASVRKGMEKAAARKAEKAAAKEAGAPKVDVSAIEAMFATAASNGLKRLAFRAEGIEISAAKASGKNPGALYVKVGGEYQGKVAGGKFFAVSATLPGTEARLLEVAADPMGQAVLYGKLTGKCSCCGRELTNAQSIEAGIGPICAGNWGL